MNNFNEICLSKKELFLLKEIDKRKQVIQTEYDEENAIRLLHYKFIRKSWFDCPNKSKTGFYEILNDGHDYLMYFYQKEKEKREENKRYWITTGIAILAIIISLIALGAELNLIKLPMP